MNAIGVVCLYSWKRAINSLWVKPLSLVNCSHPTGCVINGESINTSNLATGGIVIPFAVYPSNLTTTAVIHSLAEGGAHADHHQNKHGEKSQYKKFTWGGHLGWLHSPQQNIFWPANFLNEPSERGLCSPHLKQLMVPMELEPLNGEPASLDLYRRPLLAIFVDSSLGIRWWFQVPSATLGWLGWSIDFQ